MRETSAAFAWRRWVRLRFGGVVTVCDRRIGRSYWNEGDIVARMWRARGGNEFGSGGGGIDDLETINGGRFIVNAARNINIARLGEPYTRFITIIGEISSRAFHTSF